MSFIIVPTSWIIYKIQSIENLSYSYIQECKSKGDALEWIKKNGEQNSQYSVMEVFKK